MNETVEALRTLTKIDPSIWQTIDWGQGDYRSVLEKKITPSLTRDELETVFSFISDGHAKRIARHMFKENPMRYKEYGEEYDLIVPDKEYLLWAWDNESDSRKWKIFNQLARSSFLTKEFVEENEDYAIQWLNEYKSSDVHRWDKADISKVLHMFSAKRLGVVVLGIQDIDIMQKARSLLRNAQVEVCHYCDANMRKSTIKHPCKYCGKATHRACIRKTPVYNKHKGRRRWSTEKMRFVEIPNKNNNPDVSELYSQYCLQCKEDLENNVKIELVNQ